MTCAYYFERAGGQAKLCAGEAMGGALSRQAVDKMGAAALEGGLDGGIARRRPRLRRARRVSKSINLIGKLRLCPYLAYRLDS